MKYRLDVLSLYTFVIILLMTTTGIARAEQTPHPPSAGAACPNLSGRWDVTCEGQGIGPEVINIPSQSGCDSLDVDSGLGPQTVGTTVFSRLTQSEPLTSISSYSLDWSADRKSLLYTRTFIQRMNYGNGDRAVQHFIETGDLSLTPEGQLKAVIKNNMTQVANGLSTSVPNTSVCISHGHAN